MIDLIVEASLRSLALAAAVWVGVAAVRVRQAQVEKMIWTTVLAGAVAMPVVMQWKLTPILPAASFALPEIALRVAGVGFPGRLHAMIALIYTSVSLALLARLAIGFGRMLRVRRGGLRIHEDWVQGADVRIAERVSSPVTFGSTILLPTSYTTWSDTKRSAVLAHEGAHVRHRDCQIQWLAAVHECIFWFSPLAWWLRRHLAELAEHTSDDTVLRGSADRADYAAVLLEAAQARPTVRIAVSMASGGVARRIERILSGEYAGRSPARWQCALAITSILPLIALAAAAAHVKGAHATRAQNAVTPGARLEMNTAEPRILTTASAAELEKWYPESAKRARVDGLVQITVTLDEAGRATDTLVISEYPPAMGFGAAASGLVHHFTYVNPTAHPAVITFNVKFALDRPAKSTQSKTTQFESNGTTDSPAP